MQDQMSEKSIIANEMGLNSTAILSSWLEAVTSVQNKILNLYNWEIKKLL